MKYISTQSKLTLIISILYTSFYNLTFFKKTLEVYPLSSKNVFFIISIVIVLTCIINIILNILRFKIYFKPLMILLFFLSAMASYSIDKFGIIIDKTMFLNIANSDLKEIKELLNIKLIIYLLTLGFLPSLLLYKIKITYLSKKVELISRFKTLGFSFAIIIVLLFSFGKFYASFLRENKPLRYYTNPTYYIFSAGKYVSQLMSTSHDQIEPIGEDAKIPDIDIDRELIILVVGETVRFDRFSLNGYAKETNPLLQKEDVISFSNVESCGTSTAVSVPCMFSKFSRIDYSDAKGQKYENLLDLLHHTQKVSVLWRDNNSDSKGVAVRGEFQDYKSPDINTICDVECRDEGMLIGLEKYIKSKPTGDIFIVLHQMGNHGPAYYKRYPKEFEKFKPTCKTNALEKCSNQEISNAYDNAILYTDYFLSKVIKFLKNYSNQFETAMVYISDHGESLGENGVYLHGLPYFMAPAEQIKVPMIMWFGGELRKDLDFASLKKRTQNSYSHDNIFHTMLGIMEVESSDYDKNLDILYGVYHHSPRTPY